MDALESVRRFSLEKNVEIATKLIYLSKQCLTEFTRSGSVHSSNAELIFFAIDQSWNCVFHTGDWFTIDPREIGVYKMLGRFLSLTESIGLILSLSFR